MPLFGTQGHVSFFCKGRYFCPSCHMKRVLQFSEWLIEEVLESVTHQQYVFTIPKIIRPYFKYDRLFGEADLYLFVS